MGAAFGCSCDSKQDQAEISLMQPVSKGEIGFKRAQNANHSMQSPDDSEIMAAAEGALLESVNQSPEKDLSGRVGSATLDDQHISQ